MTRLVAIGGGSGLSVVLRGLKHHVGEDREQLTAIVTMTDDGGSSGRLRRDLGVLPPGDIRNCITALAEDEDLLTSLFRYRFPAGPGLAGHSFGNLFLTALTGITGDFYQAVLTAEEILSVRGRILPSTLHDVRLRGRGLSGEIFEGESAIGASGERLASLELLPPRAPAFPGAVEAIERADLILLGPGSLYTSILPNLLVPSLNAAVRRASAPVVLILNLMTQPGETDAMTAVEHLDAIEQHAGRELIDCVLTSSAQPEEKTVKLYRQAGSELVVVDRSAIESRGQAVITNDLLASGDLIRHDPEKLARAVLALGPA